MSRFCRASLIAAAVLPHVIKAVYYPAYPGFDDAFIHLRVAENFALGKGWGVNAFEPINVSSSPLFTLLLAAGRWLTTADIALGMWMSAVATSAAVAAAYVLARMTGSSARLALLPPLFFAANVHLWRWNATAMEPTLACLALAMSMAAFLWARSGDPIRFGLFGVAVGMAFLTRFELGLLLPAGVVALLACPVGGHGTYGVSIRRLGWTMLGFLPVAAAWFLFCWAVFGALLPTTFLSKASSISLTNATTVRSIVIVMATSLWVPAMLAGVVLYKPVKREGWAAVSRLIEPFLLPAVFAVSCVAFYALAVAELQSAARYLLPTLYASSLVLGGIIARGVAQGAPRLRSVLPAAVVAHVTAMLIINHLAVAPVLRGFQDNYWRASRQAADYLASVATPGDRVFAVSDIGILAYYSRDRYRIVDGPGLAAPTPRLRPVERFRRSDARFVVEHYGESGSAWFSWAPMHEYPRVRTFRFAAAGLVSTKDAFSLNIYERPAR